MLPAGGDDLILADISVILDLVGEQRLGAFPHGFVKQSDSQIRHANILRQPLAPDLSQRAKCLLQRYDALRPVDRQQIDIVKTERLQADINRARKAYLKPLAEHEVPVVKAPVEIAGADARKT